MEYGGLAVGVSRGEKINMQRASRILFIKSWSTVEKKNNYKYKRGWHEHERPLWLSSMTLRDEEIERERQGADSLRDSKAGQKRSIELKQANSIEIQAPHEMLGKERDREAEPVIAIDHRT